MSNASTSKNSTTKAQHNMSIYDGFSIVWLFFNMFYSYFLYYVMVFLIATATALWYYGIEENYFVRGFKNIWNAHIGSLTFASLIVAIVSMLKNAADNQNNNQNDPSMIMTYYIIVLYNSYNYNNRVIFFEILTLPLIIIRIISVSIIMKSSQHSQYDYI